MPKSENMSAQQRYAYAIGKAEAYKHYLDTWVRVKDIVDANIKQTTEHLMECRSEIQAAEEDLLNVVASTKLLESLNQPMKGKK